MASKTEELMLEITATANYVNIMRNTLLMSYEVLKICTKTKQKFFLNVKLDLFLIDDLL